MEPVAVTVLEKLENMTKFLERAPEGIVVEVGVYQGGSLYYLAKRFPQRSFLGYDTFAGLPIPSGFDNHHKQGDFQADYLEVKENLALDNVKLYWEFFPTQVHQDLSNIAMAHLDVDLYHSTLNGLRFLYPRLVKGGRIYCDDVYVATCEGATKAYLEFCREMQMNVRSENAKGWTHAYIEK